MAIKKQPPKPLPKKGETRRLPQMPERSTGGGGGEGERLQSGMVPEQWNAAVRLQCAVRDAIDRPVGLVDAFDFAARLFKTPEFTSGQMCKVFAVEHDEDERDRRAAKEDERRRIASAAR
jgi:hypothetical protein